MNNLQISDLNLYFGERKILSSVSFNMNEKTRAALAGANGCGKSTLFKVISGDLEADSINMSITRGARVAYLPQSDIVFHGETVYEAAERGYERFLPLIAELTDLEDSLSESSDSYKIERISELHDTLTESGYYDRKARIGSILMGLGFKERDFTESTETFSGGWQMRIALAKVLIEDPDFLLLDEPTNYLDIEALTWLSEYLRAFKGGVMLVSHDQNFLDETCSEVYELNNGKLRNYQGNYTKYVKVREEEIRTLEAEYRKQQEEIQKTEEFIEKFRYKATKAKQVQSRIKMLEKIDEIEVPAHLKKVSFSFPEAPRSGNDVMIVENLHKAYGDNVIYNDFSFIVNKGERLAITGRNGTGKSTLLRIIAGKDDDYEGTVRDGAGVKKGYFAQDAEHTLNPELDMLEELETVADTRDIPKLRNMLGAFLFRDDDIYKKCGVLSGGEKSRLSLLKMLLHPANLLLLDAPTNHLDINTKEMLLEALEGYEGTVIFVSHDKHFISKLATRILYLTDEGPEFFEGDFEYFNYKLKEKEEQYLLEQKAASAEVNEVRKDSVLSHEERKQRKNRLKSLEREIESIELDIASLDDQIAERDEFSMRPEVYSDPKRITEVLDEKAELERVRDEKELLWAERSEEYEELSGDEDN